MAKRDTSSSAGNGGKSSKPNILVIWGDDIGMEKLTTSLSGAGR